MNNLGIKLETLVLLCLLALRIGKVLDDRRLCDLLILI